MQNNYVSLGAIKGVTQAMVDQVLALMNDFKEGRYEFDEGAYMNAESYTTQASEDRQFESHVNYVDIQIIISGQEIIEVTHVLNPALEVITPYVPERDIQFLNGSVEPDKVELTAGQCCVLCPKDAHKPCVNWDGKHKVQKIVIKIPVELFK